MNFRSIFPIINRRKTRIPNFFYCAPKTGSTTLFYIFWKHKEVCAARGKEPNFFSNDDYFSKGADQFWHEKFGDRAEGKKIAADFSTTYFLSGQYQKSISRIFSYQSPRKIFFSTCVRHPLMWHWSHYLHRCRNIDGFRKMEPVSSSFAEFLDTAMQRGELNTFDAPVGYVMNIYRRRRALRNLEILIYERDVEPDITIAYEKLCTLLSIDPANLETWDNIISNERVESTEVIDRFAGAGTFAQVRTNRSYIPAIYKAKESGQTEKGVSFSSGDIIIERDPNNITVVANPNREQENWYLGHHDRITTNLGREAVEEFTAVYFERSVEAMEALLGKEIPEWRIDCLKLPNVEIVEPTYL